MTDTHFADVRTTSSHRAMATACGLLAAYASEREVADTLGKDRRTLRLWRQRRTGPPWVKIGADPYYPRDGFGKWVQARIIDPAADSRKRG